MAANNGNGKGDPVKGELRIVEETKMSLARLNERTVPGKLNSAPVHILSKDRKKTFSKVTLGKAAAELLPTILTRQGHKTPAERHQAVLTGLYDIGEEIRSVVGKSTLLMTTKDVVEKYLLCYDCHKPSASGVRCHIRNRNDDQNCHTICYEHIIEACKGSDAELVCEHHEVRNHLIGPYFGDWLPNHLNALILIVSGAYTCEECQVLVPVSDYRTHCDADIHRKDKKKKHRSSTGKGSSTDDSTRKASRTEILNEIIEMRRQAKQELEKNFAIIKQKDEEIKTLKAEHKTVIGNKDQEHVEKLTKLRTELEETKRKAEQDRDQLYSAQIEVEKKQRELESIVSTHEAKEKLLQQQLKKVQKDTSLTQTIQEALNKVTRERDEAKAKLAEVETSKEQTFQEVTIECIKLFRDLLIQAFEVNNDTEYQVSTKTALLNIKGIEDQLTHVGYEAQKQLLREIYGETNDQITIRSVSNPTNRLFSPFNCPRQDMTVTLIGDFKNDEQGNPLDRPRTSYKKNVDSGKYYEKLQEIMAAMLGTEFDNTAALEFTHRLLSLDKKADNKPSCIEMLGGCKDWVLLCGEYSKLAHLVTGHPYSKTDLRSHMPTKTSFVQNNKALPEITKHIDLKILSTLNTNELNNDQITEQTVTGLKEQLRLLKPGDTEFTFESLERQITTIQRKSER